MEGEEVEGEEVEGEEVEGEEVEGEEVEGEEVEGEEVEGEEVEGEEVRALEYGVKGTPGQMPYHECQDYSPHLCQNTLEQLWSLIGTHTHKQASIGTSLDG